MSLNKTDLLKLRRAIEASWKADTAYLKVHEDGNPSLGQCYPTSWIVQHFFPESEIVEGEVVTHEGTEKHFWNLFPTDNGDVHVDLTWQQFPNGSYVSEWKKRDRDSLNDGEQTVKRCELLLSRVNQQFKN